MLVQVGVPGMLTALVLYMLVNVWTDVRYLKTKNGWHALFLFGFTFVAVATGHILTLVAVVLCTSALFYLMRHIPYTTLGAGDCKMLVICTMGLQLMYDFIDPICTSIAVVSIYLVCSFTQASILKLMCGVKRSDISFLQYKVGGNHMTTPEAIPIFVAMIIYTIVGRV